MKRDNIVDYAAAAFRYYALQGQPSFEELRERIRKEAFYDTANKELCGCSNNIAKPTEYQVMRMEEAEQEQEAELLDIVAVCDTLERIRRLNNGDRIERAVKKVYMTDLKRELNEKGFISAKVMLLSLELPAGEASIYRWLKKARELFAQARGLRMEQCCKADERTAIRWLDTRRNDQIKISL